MNILVVDDVEPIRRLLSRVLTQQGCVVKNAASGREALELAAAARFQLAILDVDLGSGMDGIALAEQLRALHPHLCVVMMSGNPENETRVAQAGLGKLLPKPFDIAEIASFLTWGRSA